MRSVCLVVASVIIVSLVGGCECCKKSKKQQEQAFDPAEQYPEWAYDAPFYFRPAADRGDIGLEVPPRWPGGPTHYYTRSRMVYLPRPSRTPETSPVMPTLGPRIREAGLAPRVGVYWTDSGGLEWRKAGYFGLGQTHFVFPAENDGTYGFRFIGPQMPPAKCSPPRPQVVYHVDTVPPEVVVYVEPNRPVYDVNETVTVHWMTDDVHLVDACVSISACWGTCANDQVPWSQIKSGQPREGSTTFVISPQAIGKCVTIRAAARDLAGNVGVGVSIPLPVVAEAPTSPPVATTNPATPTTQPVEEHAQVVSASGERDLACFADSPSMSELEALPDREVAEFHLDSMFGPPYPFQPAEVKAQVVSVSDECDLARFADLPSMSELEALPTGEAAESCLDLTFGPPYPFPLSTPDPSAAHEHGASLPWRRLSGGDGAGSDAVWCVPVWRLPMTAAHAHWEPGQPGRLARSR